MELTIQQRHWLAYIARYHPAVSMKVRKVTGEALAAKGLVVQAYVPLVARPGYKLSAAGVQYVKQWGIKL